MQVTCQHCAQPFTSQGGRGRTPTYCSTRCRVAAHRERANREFWLTNGGKRWTRAAGKRPIMVDGSPASSTNPETWTTYDRVTIGDNLAGDGYGVMLGDGLACYDIDHCFDPCTPRLTLTPWARDTIAMIRRSRCRVIFAEVSCSGNGLHVFVEGEPGPGRRTNNYEYYSRDRFIRVTGQRVEVENLV